MKSFVITTADSVGWWVSRTSISWSNYLVSELRVGLTHHICTYAQLFSCSGCVGRVCVSVQQVIEGTCCKSTCFVVDSFVHRLTVIACLFCFEWCSHFLHSGSTLAPLLTMAF